MHDNLVILEVELYELTLGNRRPGGLGLVPTQQNILRQYLNTLSQNETIR